MEVVSFEGSYTTPVDSAYVVSLEVSALLSVLVSVPYVFVAYVLYALLAPVTPFTLIISPSLVILVTIVIGMRREKN